MKIFIDAGHNPCSVDTGAEGNGLKEQDVTFAIAESLAGKLERVGVEVKRSRTDTDAVIGSSLSDSLAKRAKMANDWGADLFLSIHCNAFYLSSANGTETYVYSKGSKVKDLAERIAGSVSSQMGVRNRGGKTASFAVLKQTAMPAILIETAFITNPSDAEKLKNSEAFADAIFAELCSYYEWKKEESVVSDKPEAYKYHIEGVTHVVEIDPRNIWAVQTQERTNKTGFDNFVNSIFFMNQADGKVHPQGIMVNAGEVLCNNPTHKKPVATLVVYSKDDVRMKYIDDITKEQNVWFAVSGYGIYPEITATTEGFVGAFADVTRKTNRPIIGYRYKDNKIVIAVRENSDAQRAFLTAKNLGLDFAISLDGGGSTTLKVGGKYKFQGDGRRLYGGLIWC